MVRRAIGFITGKISGLERAAFWLAGFSALSLLLGFVRDRILAHYFGAGQELDIYYAAFKIPDVLFATVASLVSASILVPVFMGKEKKEDLKKIIDSVLSSFSILIVISCAILFFLMPLLVQIFFGSLGEMTEQIIYFSRIMLLSPLFLGFSNFFGSIVQYEKRFILYSLSPLLYNVGIIGGLLFFSEYGIASAVWGVCVGAFLHLLIQKMFVFFSPERPHFVTNIWSKEVRHIFALSIPRTLSLSVSSIAMLFLASIASQSSYGSIALFTLAFNLQSVLLSLIGVSFSQAAFPTLAEHHSKSEWVELGKCLSSGLRQIIFWSLPLAGLLIILRAHIVRVILGSGAFDWSDTRMTAAVLAIFVFSVVFQSIQLFLTRAHYAFGKTKVPLIMNISGTILTIILAYIFSNFASISDPIISFLSNILKVSDLPRSSVLLLPLAFSIGSIVSSFLLWFSIPTNIRKAYEHPIWHSVRDAVLTSIILIMATAFALRVFNDFFIELDTLQSVFFHGLLSGLVGLFAAFFFLKIIKNRELGEVMKN